MKHRIVYNLNKPTFACGRPFNVQQGAHCLSPCTCPECIHIAQVQNYYREKNNEHQR